MAAVQRKLVHKQFNSPIGLYSDNNVKATLDRELKVLSNGTMGIDFDDSIKPANLANSAVLRMLEEEENLKRQPGLKKVIWPPENERTPVRTFASQERHQSPAQPPIHQQRGDFNYQNSQNPNYLNGNLTQSQSSQSIPYNQHTPTQPIYDQQQFQPSQQNYSNFPQSDYQQQQQQQPRSNNYQDVQPIYQRQHKQQPIAPPSQYQPIVPLSQQQQQPIEPRSQYQPIAPQSQQQPTSAYPISNFVNPEPTYMQQNTPSYIQTPRSAYPRGASPSTTAFSGGLAITANKPANTVPYSISPQPSQSFSNIGQQQPQYQPQSQPQYQPQYQEQQQQQQQQQQQPQYSASQSSVIPTSPDIYNTRGWSHVNSPTPIRTGYTQNYPLNQQSSPSFGSTGVIGQTYIGDQNQYSSNEQQQQQQQTQYQQPQTRPQYQPPQQQYQPPQQQQQQQYNYQTPQQQQQQQQPGYQQQQPGYQQQQREPSYTTEAVLQKAHQPGSGIITLRKEAPISQKQAPVFTSQPATASFGGGGNMRGDQKWPPIEYKIQAQVENEERRKLALGPACRPRRVEKDYGEFFNRHALNSAYPSYRVPPGTQYYKCGNYN